MNIKATKVFYKNRDSKAQIVINRGGSRSSKCLAKGTEIVMFDGSLKKVEAVKIGDKVMGIDSTPRTVLELHQGIGNLYLVSQNKGIDYIVEEDHLLQLRRSTGAKNDLKKYSKGKIYTKKVSGRYYQYGDEISIKVKDFYTKSKRFKCNFYGYRVPINFSEKSLDIDPYFLGLWLGDGHKHQLSITTMDPEIVDYLYKYTDKISAVIRVESKNKENKAKIYNIIEGCAFELHNAFLSLLPCIKNKTYSLSRAARELGIQRSTLKRWVIGTENGTFDINSRSNVNQSKFKTKLASLFTKYNLFNNKHIPSDFLYNSRENRLLLLAGLLDTDGCLGKCGGFTIIQKDENLANKIYYLASSLGFRCSIKSRISTIKSINFSGLYYDVSIYGEIENIPTRIQRKKFIRKTKFSRNHCVSGIKVTPHGVGEYYGFSLDGDGLFLLKDFTVVHNSYSIAQLLLLERFFTQKNKKILVLRKTLPSLRTSVYLDWKKFMDQYNLYSIIDENKQYLDYYYKPNNNYLHFGSLDSPEKIKCFHPDTDIFTINGFKNIKDVKIGDLVASLNPETGKAEFKPIINYFVYDYKGNMISPASATGDRDSYAGFCVTPEHKMLTHTVRKREWEFVEAKDLFQTYYIRQSAEFDCGNIKDYFEIPKLDYGNNINWGKKIYKEGSNKKWCSKKNGRKTVIFPIINWLQFFGWYISEGCIYEGTITLSQVKEEGRKKIREVLENFPYNYNEGKRAFYVHGKDLSNYLKQFGKSHEKFIPRELLNLKPFLLQYLFDALMEGDGIKTSKNRWMYCTTSEQLREDVIEIAIKLGYVASYYKIDTKKYYNERAKDAWAIYITKRMEVRLENKKEIYYEGKVYCVEVAPYHTTLTRFNSKIAWTGQSSGWHYIWLNEATDFDEDDLLQLLLRLSEPTEEGQRNQLFMCFNPIDEYHWIKTKVLDKRENFDLEEIHSTYKDNQFLSEDYKKLVESYKYIDFNKYKVYALGEWGKLENLIYTNWDITSEYVTNGEIIYGLDFGFTNPSALLKLVINDNDIFEEELIYQTELTNAQLIEKCNELKVSKTFPIYCFHPDTLIRMQDETEKCISDVKIGDILHNNKNVLNIMRRNYEGNLLKIKTQSSFEPLRCTPDHKIPIIPGKIGRQDKRKDKKLIDSVKLVTASEINIGDYLLIPMAGIKKDIQLKFDGIGKHGGRKKIDFKFNPSIFRLLGYYTAEGSTAKWDTKFYFSLDEKETWVKDVVQIIKECFNINCSTYYDMCPSVAVVAVYSVILAEFFKYYVNGTARTKILHNDLMTMSPEYQQELLIGWLRGDGGLYIRPRNYKLCGTTTSYSLFRQMYLIAIRCGLKPSTNKRISKGSKIVKKESIAYDIIFSLEDIKKLEFFQTKAKFLRGKRIIEGQLLVRVKKIELEKYKGEVIDLDVDKDNLFVAENLLVHNCDSAEPDRIEEFRQAGYNAIESVKDVINSIDFVKRFKIHCYKPSANLIKEKMGYSRRKDKNGRIYEEPAPNIADHLMNCESYAIYSHLRFRYGSINLRFV